MQGSADQQPENQRVGNRIALAFAALAAAMSALTLCGYGLGARSLVGTRSDWQIMSVSTALLCLFLAAALSLDALKRYRGTRIAGVLVLIYSTAILAGHAVTGHDALSLALAGALRASPSYGETSAATAASIAMLAISCLRRPRAQPAGWLAIAVMVIAGLAVLGYAYGVQDLYALAPFRTMSLRTALALFLLASGFLTSNQESGVSSLLLARSVTGRTTRRQLGFLLLPPVAAWALLKATSAHEMGPGAAMAFLVVLTVGPLAALIFKDAKSLTRLDAERQDKRRADKAKLAIERRYRTLFNLLDTGFCVLEMKFDAAGRAIDYRFVEVNPAFEKQTGITGAAGRWMREIAPGHEQHWFDLYGQVALTGVPARFEYTAAALDGRHFDVSAFRVNEPETRNVALLFTDISERKSAELDMKALNETLESRVRERAAELEQTQEALRQSQKLEAIGQLTGGVAHDFNNLLTVIQGSADLLMRPNLTEERRVRFTASIQEAAARASKLTSQLLSFARRQSLRPETFDVGASLQEVMAILAPLTGASVRLNLKAPPVSCHVHADRSQFDTSIVNMVINARDAMNGAGTITITTAPVSGIPALRMHPAVPGEFVSVTITDTGAGIAEDKLGRIFEPFFTTKDVGTGTGLGLSQVIGFAKQSGGDVRVDSVEREGATFTLYLPREYADPLPQPVPDQEADIAGEGIRVLVVEDNIQVGAFAIQSLEELGYETALAKDAMQALALLQADRDRYDVVFSDVVMPGRSGLEMAGDIRGLYPGLPVVLTSGYSHVLAENGAHGFELLHKPYSIEQLSRVLRMVLARAEAERDAHQAMLRH